MTSKSALQRGLDDFYGKINTGDYSIWKNFRLLAVDGSRLHLPNHHTIKEEFGEILAGKNADSPCSMATCSMLYDPLNQVTLDARIGPYKNTAKKRAGESALLEEHLFKLKTGDLLLLDRGYPSISLFFKLMTKGVDFCVRMKGSWWHQVRQFKASGLEEQTVSFELPKKDIKKFSQQADSLPSVLTCRLIRVALDTGETEILCTSLTDAQNYPKEEFKALYHLRWNEEEAYANPKDSFGKASPRINC